MKEQFIEARAMDSETMANLSLCMAWRDVSGHTPFLFIRFESGIWL
jgi:hypothetical protein